MYRHKWESDVNMALPVGKAVCVGRNYVAHAKELNNPVPKAPLLFIKPSSALCDFGPETAINLSLGEHHYEAELVLLVGEKIDRSCTVPLNRIAGVGLGLDLTLRALQAELKQKGHPWETAKAFDASGCITPFIPVNKEMLESGLTYQFWQNDTLKQRGDSAHMIFNMAKLLTDIAKFFTLYPGDIVMTGTPEGVGALSIDDDLKLQLGQGNVYRSKVVKQSS
ncbi:isomerase/hydrolase [Pseudoalteromonas luteoviolacea]|uniref:Isomerase/hydrolase n=1 Tax=Pseudoalteromonas luteoviolacea TaxID=43657 RepID=A0A1C0TJC4_9GAMM|nr:fumarylacetoacetate hydrolase family protein [Pseudoalteromonas luteoviolacea]OCQ18367.1 isomerase/hydrolase [Pseudoalteromonas luteoviolacea]